MSWSEQILHWSNGFVEHEHRLNQASTLAEPEDYARIREGLITGWLVPTLDYRDYFSSVPPDLRTAQNIEFAKVARPRMPSLIRRYESDKGEVSYRVYLGSPNQVDPTKLSWTSLIAVQEVAGKLRGVGFYAKCSRCTQTGSYDGYRCPYCRGNRWSTRHGTRLDLGSLGEPTGVERLVRPFRPAEQADYDSDQAPAPLRDLPPYPREIT